MQVLMWHDKHGPTFWDASTPKLESKAFLALFRAIYESYGYTDIEGDCMEKLLLDKALAGDEKAARKLLHIRSHAEYEGWSLEEVLKP